MLSMAPESALVAFVEGDDLELYFQTSMHSRKYQNIQRNSKVAFVIGFDMLTVQYEGYAERINNPTLIEKTKQLFFNKESPSTPYYLNLPDTAIFKVTPKWVGYRDYSKSTPEINEIVIF